MSPLAQRRCRSTHALQVPLLMYISQVVHPSAERALIQSQLCRSLRIRHVNLTFTCFTFSSTQASAPIATPVHARQQDAVLRTAHHTVAILFCLCLARFPVATVKVLHLLYIRGACVPPFLHCSTAALDVEVNTHAIASNVLKGRIQTGGYQSM